MLSRIPRHCFALLLVGMLATSHISAQEPQWEYINSPDMGGYSRLAVDTSGSVLLVAGNLLHLRRFDISDWSPFRDPAPRSARLHMQPALDASGAPWLVTDSTLYRPLRPEATWEFVPEVRPAPADPGFLFISAPGTVFIAGPAGGALSSSDSGRAWLHAGPVSAEPARGMIALPDGSLLLWTETSLYASDDDGVSWSAVPAPSDMRQILHVCSTGRNIVLSGQRGTESYVARSFNPVAGWEDITPSLSSGARITSLSGYRGSLILLIENNSYPSLLYRPASTDVWQSLGGMPFGTTQVAFTFGGQLVGAMPNVLLHATAPGQSWKYSAAASSVTDRRPMLSPAEDVYVCYSFQDGFHRSTDGGHTWTETLDYVTGSGWELNAGIDPAQMFCVFESGWMFRSTDAGVSWAACPPPDPPYSMRIAQTPDGTLFLVDRNGDRVIRSSDLGDTWTEVHPSTSTDYNSSLHVVGTRLYLFVESRLSYTDDNGEHWQVVSEFRPETRPYELFVLEENLMLAGYTSPNRSVRSTDRGATWEDVSRSDDFTFFDIRRVPRGSTLIAQVNGSTVPLRRSTDNGRTWSRITGAIAATSQNIRVTPEGHLLIGTSGTYTGHFLWKNAAVLGVDNPPTAEAMDFTILPQPLVPGTELHIDLTLPSRENLAYRITDLLGRQWDAGGFDGAGPGRTRLSLPASTLPSGIYFLHLQSRQTQAIRRFIVTR